MTEKELIAALVPLVLDGSVSVERDESTTRVTLTQKGQARRHDSTEHERVLPDVQRPRLGPALQRHR